MTTPKRGLLYHFTHISNLASIAEHGLFCDGAIETDQADLLTTEVAEPSIKAKRRRRPVPAGPGGVVADYVPFYFSARSPMLGAIHSGRVPSYPDGQDAVIYLITDIQRLLAAGTEFVFTDRNAALEVARYGTDLTLLDEFVDWPLMEGKMWHNTEDQPGRMERRMAEFLVHRHVPWHAFLGIAAINDQRCRVATDVLASVGISTQVRSRPGWYF